MNCRAAFRAAAPKVLSARERLEMIDQLAEKLLRAMDRGSVTPELQLRALEIQGHACIGAAYERRRERGE